MLKWSGHSSCIYHPFTHRIINLLCWAMYSAIWVIYSSSSRWQLLIFLGYLFYVAHSESHVWCLPFILSPVRNVKFDVIVCYRIIGHVIHRQIFILLWLLIDAMLSFSSESFYNSKAKGKSKRTSAKCLIEF